MGKRPAAGKQQKDPNGTYLYFIVITHIITAPARPLSSYLFFSRDQREIVKTEKPELSFTEITKELGSRWQSASEQEKQKYTDMAEKDKARYQAEMEKYESSGLKEKFESENNDDSKKKRSKTESRKPKRVSAYQIYCNEMRPVLKGTNLILNTLICTCLLEKNPNLTFGEVNKALGDEWRQMEDEKKKASCNL